jgi:hypothetical protein
VHLNWTVHTVLANCSRFILVYLTELVKKKMPCFPSSLIHFDPLREIGLRVTCFMKKFSNFCSVFILFLKYRFICDS